MARQFQSLFLLTTLTSLLLISAKVEAQDRIKAPHFLPWLRKTVDLTNHLPKSFRCSYKKKCEEAKKKAKASSQSLIDAILPTPHKIDQHKAAQLKNTIKGMVNGI